MISLKEKSSNGDPSPVSADEPRAKKSKATQKKKLKKKKTKKPGVVSSANDSEAEATSASQDPSEPMTAKNNEDKEDSATQKANDTTKLNSNEAQLGDLEAWHGMGVPPPVLKALHKLGFTQPTPIQSAIIPSAILGRMDVVGAAETGSGKTLAFAIPIIDAILRDRNAANTTAETPSAQLKPNVEEAEESKTDNDPDESDDDAPLPSSPPTLKALILTPTRELAVQVRDHIDRLIQFTDIRTAVVFGGLAVQKQTRILSYGPEIVVATPGRLWDLVQEGHPHLSRLSEIK